MRLEKVCLPVCCNSGEKETQRPTRRCTSGTAWSRSLIVHLRRGLWHDAGKREILQQTPALERTTC